MKVLGWGENLIVLLRVFLYNFVPENLKHRIHRLNSAQYYFVMAHFEALAIPQKIDHE